MVFPLKMSFLGPKFSKKSLGRGGHYILHYAFLVFLGGEGIFQPERRVRSRYYGLKAGEFPAPLLCVKVCVAASVTFFKNKTWNEQVTKFGVQEVQSLVLEGEPNVWGSSRFGFIVRFRNTNLGSSRFEVRKFQGLGSSIFGIFKFVPSKPSLL